MGVCVCRRTVGVVRELRVSEYGVRARAHVRHLRVRFGVSVPWVGACVCVRVDLCSAVRGGSDAFSFQYSDGGKRGGRGRR